MKRDHQQLIQETKKIIDNTVDVLSTLKSRCKLSVMETELVDRTIDEIRELVWSVIHNETEEVPKSLRLLIAEVVKHLFSLLCGLFS